MHFTLKSSVHACTTKLSLRYVVGPKITKIILPGSEQKIADLSVETEDYSTVLYISGPPQIFPAQQTAAHPPPQHSPAPPTPASSTGQPSPTAPGTPQRRPPLPGSHSPAHPQVSDTREGQIITFSKGIYWSS